MMSYMKHCPICGKEHYLIVTDDEAMKVERYLRGKELVKDLFPEWDVNSREFLISGLCKECLDKVKDEDE